MMNELEKSDPSIVAAKPTNKSGRSDAESVEVLNGIYEQDFLGFSYGFRPGRGQHDALDALAVGITHTKVSWIVDADVRSFFDSMSHEWLIRFVEHRIGDPRMIRLIRKWLKAGVMDGGEWTSSDIGSPQGRWCLRGSRTSTFITPSTFGRTSGDATTPTGMSCSCATPTIPSLALSMRPMPSVSSWFARTAGEVRAVVESG
jgi:hypothetical protein